MLFKALTDVIIATSVVAVNGTGCTGCDGRDTVAVALLAIDRFCSLKCEGYSDNMSRPMTAVVVSKAPVRDATLVYSNSGYALAADASVRCWNGRLIGADAA